MKCASVARAAGAAVLTALTLVPGTAAASAPEAADPTAGLPGEVVAAYQRDLGLDAGQVKARVESERTAAATQRTVREFIGSSFGGAWFDSASGKLVVGVTDEAKARVVRALGAEPKVVAHAASTLADTKDKIDQAGRAPGAVTGWYVDDRANAVVVTVRRGAVDTGVAEFLDTAKA
ncbi:MAG: S1 family peptidase, partial [Umezawaea sp.]